ncbi:MAG: hypothetical protein LKI76_05495 [Megasphaera sp.]|nr:hypothetical protein [Megasphaera sp.]
MIVTNFSDDYIAAACRTAKLRIPFQRPVKRMGYATKTRDKIFGFS